jgi:hypothetical protein
MPETPPSNSDVLFADKDHTVREIYTRLLDVLREIGPFEAEPKKTSVHLVHSVGFAGVHPRKSFLYLNLRTERPIESARIVKAEQVSKNRYHNEVKLSSPAEVDAEVSGWLREAYELGSL